MPSFMYFLPNRAAGLGGDELRATGLGYAIEGGAHQRHLTGAGPSGGAGVLLAAADRMELSRVRYVPAEQEWIELPAPGALRPALYLGRWNNDAISPADLVRTKPLRGHLVELADGQSWLCPIARGQCEEDGRICWYHALPRIMSIDAGGGWAPGPVVPRLRRLWQLAEAWWEARDAAIPAGSKGGESVAIRFDQPEQAAAEVLAANYRLGPAEISLLGLFESGTARRILDALVDWPTLVALVAETQKKTASPPSAG